MLTLMHYTVTTWSKNPAWYFPVKVASYMFAISMLHLTEKNLMSNDLFGNPTVIDPVILLDNITSESLNNLHRGEKRYFIFT